MQSYFVIQFVIEIINLSKVKANLEPFSLFYGGLRSQISKHLALFSELLLFVHFLPSVKN